MDRYPADRVDLTSSRRGEIDKDLTAARALMDSGFAKVLDAFKVLGYPVGEDPNFAGSAQRAAKGMMEMVLHRRKIDNIIEDCLSSVFPSTHSDMVMVPNIPASGVCPHHFLPVLCKVTIAYIPGAIVDDTKEGPAGGYSVLGLSKIPRIVQAVCHQPVVQETLAAELSDIFHTKLKSAGSGVYIRAVHTCMACRGIQLADVHVTVSAMRGIFFESPKLRDEFMAAVNADK